MNYVPLSNRIIGKLKKVKEKKLDSGLVIPEEINKNSNPYRVVEVLAVGRGHISYSGQIVPMETKVGDIVLVMNISPFILPKDNCPEIKEDEEIVVFQETDIYCRLKRADE